MIKKGSKVILNDKYLDWTKIREEKTILTVKNIDTISDNEVAWFEEVRGAYALDGLTLLGED